MSKMVEDISCFILVYHELFSPEMCRAYKAVLNILETLECMFTGGSHLLLDFPVDDAENFLLSCLDVAGQVSPEAEEVFSEGYMHGAMRSHRCRTHVLHVPDEPTPFP